MLKNIAGRIWAIWAAVLFLATMLLFYIPFLCCLLVSEPNRSKFTYPLYRTWMQIFLPLIGISIKTTGRENINKEKQYIIICNHRSMMDIPISSTKITGPNKTIAKIEMSRIPVFGLLYKIGAVLVDRKNKDSRRQSFLAMKEVLAMKLHMIIYPEGTRNKTQETLTPFKDGAFSLAIETKTEILPAIIKGTEKIMPANKTAFLLPGTITLNILPPMPPGPSVDALKEKCFQLMKNELEKAER